FFPSQIWILNPARLPIPPPRQILDCKNRNYFLLAIKKTTIYNIPTQLISKFAPHLPKGSIKPVNNTLSHAVSSTRT
ncbi:MAG: hypothetical protein V7724_17675, partial [Sediminicola sp.]